MSGCENRMRQIVTGGNPRVQGLHTGQPDALVDVVGIRNGTDLRGHGEVIRIVGIAIQAAEQSAGHVLVPNLHFFNEQGVCAFIVNDQDPRWQRSPRPAGRFVSAVTIPGNYLSEGTLTVGAAVSTPDPVTVHFYEPDAVAFHVNDSLEGDSVRGDYAGTYPGVVRPMLRWTDRYLEEEQKVTK